MHLTDTTVKVLKNFATINSGLVVKKGSVLRTISPNKALLAEATVPEKFERDFGIYDLHKTLALLSMTEKNQVEVSKEFLSFKSMGGNGTIRQRFTEASLIDSPPDKGVNIPSYDVSFDLSVDALKWILDVSSVLKCPNIVFRSSGDGLFAWAMDVKGEIVDDANILLDQKCSVNFEAVLKIENIKIVQDEYSVDISSRGVARLLSKTNNLTYWMALEQSSSKFED